MVANGYVVRTQRIVFPLITLLGLACGRTNEGVPPPGPGGESPASGAPGDGMTAGGGRAGGTGGKGGGSEQGELSSVLLDGAPIYTRVQRLTNQQWENAVTDLLRFEERHELSAKFAPPVAGLSTFDNNERGLFVDLPKFSDFETGAEAAAALATGSPEALAALYAGDDAPGFVRALGRRAFRRPLTLEEESKYQDVFALGVKLYGAGFANGAALVVRAILESPQFLYRTELGPAGDPLNAYELSSKLSFWLLGTTPSDSLLDAAAAGDLARPDGLEAATRQMLEDPRALLTQRDFHAQLLGFSHFDNLSKLGVPEYTTALNAELKLTSDAFFDRVFQQDFGLREILTSKQAYVSPGLAPFYGFAAPKQALELRDLGPSRSGYFMQVPFLMLRGHNANSDPIDRGGALQAALLCGPPEAPPHPVPSLPLVSVGKTTRQISTQFTEACGGTCHRVYLDPLGFAFENFDGVGRERTSENGLPVDTTGSYPFAEGVEPFANATELMKIMARSAQVHTCYSKSVVSYALGRDLVEGDRPLLESLAQVSLSQSLKEIVVALVRNPAFRNRKEAQP